MWQPRGVFGQPSLTCRVTGGGSPDVVVRLGGTLSGDAASRRVERFVAEQAGEARVRRIHLDLHDLDAIDLEGIAVLVHAYRQSQRRGKSLTVEGARGPVQRRLLTTGILRIMSPQGPAASAS